MIILIIVELLKLSELRTKDIKSGINSNQPILPKICTKDNPHFIKDYCDF